MGKKAEIKMLYLIYKLYQVLEKSKHYKAQNL